MPSTTFIALRRSTIVVLSSCLFLLSFGGSAFAQSSDAAFSRALTNLASKVALDAAAKYDKVIRAFQYDVDDLTPVFNKSLYPREWRQVIELGGRRTALDHEYHNGYLPRNQLSVSLLALVMPVALNANFKHQVLPGKGVLPQTFLGANAWFVPKVVKDFTFELLNQEESEEFALWGGSAFAVFARDLRPDIKVFGGYRFAYGTFKMDVPASVQESDTASIVLGLLFESTSDLQTNWFLNEFLWGVGFLTKSNNETSFYVGYEPFHIYLYYKMEMRFRRLTYGVGLHPDNVLAVRPYVKMHFRF